jgi:hypothetical protein
MVGKRLDKKAQTRRRRVSQASYRRSKKQTGGLVCAPCFGILPTIATGLGGAVGLSSMSSSSSVERRKDSQGETIVTRLERTKPSGTRRAKGKKMSKGKGKSKTLKTQVERLVVKLVNPVKKKGYILKNGKKVNLAKKPYKGLPLKKAYSKLLQTCQDKGFDKC